MAIRERKGRASPWQVYWNNPFTGRRECANFATKEEALKEESLIKHRLKFERDSFRKEEEQDERGTDLTLEQAWFLYLKQKQFNKAGLAWQMDCMKEALKLYGTTSLKAIGYGEIVNVMEKLQQRHIKPATVRGRMSVLRTVMRWCAANSLCSEVRFPKLPPANYEKFVPPTPGEIESIIAAAESHIIRVVILGAQCGIRVGPSELLRLKWTDVDLEQRLIRVPGAKKNAGCAWREVPIREQLLPLLKCWQAQDEATGTSYVINFNGRQVCSIKRAWKSALARAGITRRIRPYDLRHAFATELIAAGVDIGTIAKLMGHSSPAMILNHYQYVMDVQKRSAVEKLPDVPCAQKYVPKKGVTASATITP